LRLRARAHLPQQVQVRAAQGAVLGDVRDDVALAAGLVEPLEGLPEVASLAGPAPGGEGGAAHVEADGDAVAVLGEDLRGPLRVSSAAVARLTRRHPVARAPATDSSSRIPPESSTSISTAATTSASIEALLPRPKAASRSTRCSQLAPPSWNASAASNGAP